MNHRLSSGRAASALAACAMLLPGCASVGTPGFLKGSEAGAEGNRQAPSQAGASNLDLHPKEITSVAPMASVMLEKKCPNIVQPYRLSDNVASLGMFSARKGLESLGRALAGAMGAGNAAAAQQSGIPAATKLAAKQLNWLPMSVETMYGERAHREETNLLKRDTKPGKKYYPIADKMLDEVKAKIGQPHNYEFKLFILKSEGTGALSRPGGYLYLEQGLLDNEAQHPKAYFAIAHEMAHVLQRHETMELQSMIVDSFSVGEQMQTTIASAGANPEAVLAHVKVGKNLFIRHHIDQELQADSCATRLLSRVFPDRQQLAQSLNGFLKALPPPEPASMAPAPASDVERLAATMHDVVDKPIKVHPNSAEREANLRAMTAAVAEDASPGSR